MTDKQRQENLEEIMKDKFYIEHLMDFEDCESVDDVIDATCKLLVDNFEIAMDGTYIRELIEQACYLSSDRREVWSNDDRASIEAMRKKAC